MNCNNCYYLRGHDHIYWCACEEATEEQIEGKEDCEHFKVYWCKQKDPYHADDGGYKE